MSQLYSNCPTYWNLNDHQTSGSLSNGLSLKVDSPPQLHLKARSFYFNLQDHDSSSSQSTPNRDLAAPAVTNSQEQCLSSESGQEVSCAKNGGQAKPVYLMDLTDGSFNAGQIDYNRAMTYMPYSCADPNFNGLMTAYGSPPFMHPHMMGVTNARVPLPLDISDDEPVYVNAKQYHGILRRRQFRAKMEAQNKLIKVRKPYLHESRHLHALNRVRGSGGRFLSTKKSQQSDSNSTTPPNHAVFKSTGFDHDGNTLFFEHHQPPRDPERANSNGVGFFQQPGHGFSGMPSSHAAGPMQRNAGFMNKANQQHYASVVQ